MHVAFFAKLVAFSRMPLLVMFWSHARLVGCARFLFLCVVLVFAPCSLLAFLSFWFVSLSVLLADRLLGFSSCLLCRSGLLGDVTAGGHLRLDAERFAC